MNPLTRTKTLKAVIFDMDGVITDTMPYHFRAWKKTFIDEGIPATKYEIYRREGQKGIVSVQEIFAEYGKPFSLELGREILARKEILFKKIVRRRFIVGARSFVRLLTGKRIPLALVTGTSRHEVEKTLPRALLKSFSVIVSGTDVKNGKPHPEPYRKAIKALNVSKREVVVIENAPFGIRSAKAAELACFAIETSLPKKYLRQADHVFHDFKSLRAYFRGRYDI